MTTKGQFRIQKISDIGTSNPIMSRLTMGMFDIVKMAEINDQIRTSINEINFNIAQDLAKAEAIGLKICGSIDVVMKRLDDEGVRTQSFDRCVDVPSAEGLDDIRDFLKYGKKVLQELIKTFNLFVKTNCFNPRYDKVYSALKSQYGEDDPLTKLVKEDHDLWIKKFLSFRDQDEHPTVENLYLDFDIRWDETSQKWGVFLPKFYDGTSIYEFIKSSVHNLLTFVEEINIFFLQKVMPKVVEIYEIPEVERKKDCEIRFRMGIKEEFRKGVQPNIDSHHENKGA